MINRDLKRHTNKEKTRRPVPIRLIALIMALVMVLSVVYVNNRNGEVRAGTPSFSEVVDNEFLYNNENLKLPTKICDPNSSYEVLNAALTSIENKEISVYVPSDKVTFTKFYNYNSIEGITVTLYKTEGKYYLTKPESNFSETGTEGTGTEGTGTEGTGTEGTNPGTGDSSSDENAIEEINATVTYTTTWSGNSVKPTTSGSEVSLSGSYDFKVGDTNVTVEDAPSPNKLRTLKVYKEAFEDIAVNSEGIVSDTNYDNRMGTSSSENTLYYGTIELSKTDGDQTTKISNFDDINKTIQGLAENEKYTTTINKIIYVGSDEEEGQTKKVIASVSTDIKYQKNKTLINNVKIISGDTEIYNAEYSSAVEKNAVNPNSTITVQITTDIPLSKGITVTSSEEGDYKKPVGAVKYVSTGEGPYTHSFEIPNYYPTCVGKKVQYSITVSDDDSELIDEGYELSQNFSLKISYDDGKTSISQVQVNDEKIDSGGMLYTNLASSEIEVTATVKEGSSATLTKAFVGSKEINNVSESGKIITGSIENSEGNTHYDIKAVNSYGQESEPYPINIFYDSVAPLISDVTISQTGDPISTDAKYTATKPVTVSFKVLDRKKEETLADDTMSGINADSIMVSKKGETAKINASGTYNPTTGIYTFEIPSGDLTEFLAGGKQNYVINADDNAGNNATSLPFTIEFYNETVEIKEFTVSKSNYNGDDKDTSNYGIKWGEDDLGKASRNVTITYKFVSELPVTATFSGGLATVSVDNDEKTVTVSMNFTTTTTIDELKLVLKNANYSTGSTQKTTWDEHKITTMVVDLTDPAYDPDLTASDVTPIISTESTYSDKRLLGSDWYQNLVLIIKAEDNDSGIDSLTATGIDGDIEFTKDGTSWEGVAKVKKSDETTKKTDVLFTLTDKSGNVTPSRTFTYHVDPDPPKDLKIMVDGVDKNGVVYCKNDPTINVSGIDAISDVHNELEYSYLEYGSSHLSLEDAQDKKLSDIVNACGEEYSENKNYKLKLVICDNAGNETSKEITIRVDGSAPKASIVYNDASKDKHKNDYFGALVDEVKLDLSIEDKSIKSATVTDNGNVIDNVNWTKDENGWTATISVKTEDDHNIVLSAVDLSDNPSNTATKHFCIDRTNPDVITKLNGSEYTEMNSYQKSSVTTEITVNDKNEDINPEAVKVTIVRTKPEGGTVTEEKNGKGPFTISEDGYYTVKYVVKDRAGNTTTKTIGFTVDNGKPVHNIHVTTKADKADRFANNYTNKVGRFGDAIESYSYGIYYKDAVSIDVAYFDYNLPSENVIVYDNDVPVSVSWDGKAPLGKASFTVSEEGFHRIRMESTDKSGNHVVDDKVVEFIIDKTAPVLTTYLNDAKYDAANSYVGDSNSKVEVVDLYEDADDESVAITWTTPTGEVTNSTVAGKGPVTFTEDGYYTVNYTVTDRAGNTSTKGIGLTVDKTAPVHNIYVLTPNPAKFDDYKHTYSNKLGIFNKRENQEEYDYGQYYGASVLLELNVFEYNLDWVYVTDNGEEIKPEWKFENGYGTAMYIVSGQGYHEIKMWSKDLSGNEINDTAPQKKVGFTIDETYPVITTYVNGSLYTEGSGERYLNTNATVSVSVEDTNKDTYDLLRSYKQTPPGGSASTGSEYVSEGSEVYATEADYEVQYKAIDLAGNESYVSNVYFRVDKTPPQLTISDIGGSSNASSVALTFNCKEAFYWDMNSCHYNIYKKRDGVGESQEKSADFTPRSANDSTSYTFTDDAEYRIEFDAEDKCGNKAETNYTFIKDGTAPLILLSGVSNYDKTDKDVELLVSIDEAFYTSNKVTLSGTRTDIDGKSSAIEFDPFSTNRSKISELKQLFKEDGIYDITVTSVDKAGNKSSKSVHFTIDTTDPEIGDLSKYDNVKLNKFEWDVDLDELVKDLTVCDISVYLDGALYDGNTELADGSHVLRVEAVDELGHKSFKEVTFVLDTKGPNIIVSNVEDGDNLLESTQVTVTVEIDEDVLDTVKLNDETVKVENNQATFTVNSRGSYKLTATAHDDAGNKSSAEINFTFGKQLNLLLIGIIAGICILLLLILLIILKRRKNEEK